MIPPFADVICDCRALPEQTEADIRDHVARALGGRTPVRAGPPRTAGGGHRVSDRHAAVSDPRGVRRAPPGGARLLPIISAGFTDSHWVRKELGTVAYGFAPVFETDPQAYEDAAHAADESLEIADLAEMAEFNLHVLRALGPPI